MKIKRHIPSSTRRALANRAIGTAAFLEEFADWLTEMAFAQNINLWAQADSDLPITFKRGDVRLLIDVMRQRANEIRRFERKSN